MITSPQKILVVRNDKLGDFMLTCPTFALLREALPDARIDALVQDYTAPMAEQFAGIDTVIRDPGPGWGSTLALARRLRRERYDAVIVLFSTTRIGLALWLAGIPVRLAPATKLAQIFYNRRVRQRRSRSEKPEYEYNRDLAVALLQEWGIVEPGPFTPPCLRFPPEEREATRKDFLARYRLPDDSRLLFVHPGHGGSANNLRVDQFAELIRQLDPVPPWRIVITAGPGEESQARALADGIADRQPIVHVSREGLATFARHLDLADLFISGSTGPLHIAGALDRPTAAFYTRRRSATSLRWQTLNAPERRLAFSPPETAEAEDMSQVDLAAAAEAIRARFIAVSGEG